MSNHRRFQLRLTRLIGGPLLIVLSTLLAVASLHAAESADDAPLRVLPKGQLPKDQRLQPLKDLEGYFPFKPRETPAEWDLRAEQVRRELAVALGLWPMPEKTPLNAVIHGKIDRPDYTVEKVYFESIPGFFVTGNLYRPKGKTGRLPGVLSPHGHWKNGRFTETAADELRKQIARGEERFTPAVARIATGQQRSRAVDGRNAG